jgi:hypothetical protein
MITLIKTKTGIYPSKDRYLWTALDGMGRIGTGHSDIEAIGDLVLSYKELIVSDDNKTFTLDVEIK